MKYFKVTSVVATEDLILVVSELEGKVKNGECGLIIVDSDFPTFTGVLPVYLSINNVKLEMLDKYGNKLYSDQVREHSVYQGEWGTLDPVHFKLCSCVPMSSKNPGVYLAGVSTEEVNAAIAAYSTSKTRAKEV